VKAARKASPWGRLTATRRIVLAREEEVKLETQLESRCGGLPQPRGKGRTAAGPRGLALASEGLLSVKRPRGGLLRFQDEYTIVGTYTLTELSLAETEEVTQTEEVPGATAMVTATATATALPPPPPQRAARASCRSLLATCHVSSGSTAPYASHSH